MDALITHYLLVFFLVLFLYISFRLFFERKELSLLAFFSIPIIIILTIQAYLKTSNANWALTAYPAACIILSSFAINKKSKFLRSTISLGIIINFLISAFINLKFLNSLSFFNLFFFKLTL